ncbi:MAG: hypothetical protein MK135_14850, partial [Polyangiaceae bacterium]|nr:hypothetical protein [Polyangiaceae bacterium]
MNYLGHAAVAVYLGVSPQVTFGAMLPDLIKMSAPEVLERQLFEIIDAFPLDHPLLLGTDLHRRTDQVFHQHPQFLAWNARLVKELRTRGVKKGPARAAAHIGVEMLLDSHYVKTPQLADGYYSALHFGCSWQAPLGSLKESVIPTTHRVLAHMNEQGATIH